MERTVPWSYDGPGAIIAATSWILYSSEIARNRNCNRYHGMTQTQAQTHRAGALV
jgi:hypothetical protein